jgi:hypothetical protein
LPASPRAEFIPGLGDITSFTVDIKKDINSNIWSENVTGTIVHKQPEVADKSPDGATTSDDLLAEEKKVTSPATLTKQDQAKASLSGASNRKAFTVQDKVRSHFYFPICLHTYWNVFWFQISHTHRGRPLAASGRCQVWGRESTGL